MALFKSQEELIAQEEEKLQALLEKYGVDDLRDPRDLEAVTNIASNMMSSNLMTVGMALKGKSEVIAQVGFLRTMVEQNFIMIRQLDKISRQLARISKKIPKDE